MKIRMNGRGRAYSIAAGTTAVMAGAAAAIALTAGGHAAAVRHPASGARLIASSCSGPAGAAYVSDSGWDGFSAIDTATCQVIQTYNVGDTQPGAPGTSSCSSCWRHGACEGAQGLSAARARSRSSASGMASARSWRSRRVAWPDSSSGCRSGEPPVPVGLPAVQGHAVLPCAQVQPPLPDPVGRDLVGDADRRLGMRVHDQPLHPVEQGPAGGSMPSI